MCCNMLSSRLSKFSISTRSVFANVNGRPFYCFYCTRSVPSYLPWLILNHTYHFHIFFSISTCASTFQVVKLVKEFVLPRLAFISLVSLAGLLKHCALSTDFNYFYGSAFFLNSLAVNWSIAFCSYLRIIFVCIFHGTLWFWQSPPCIAIRFVARRFIFWVWIQARIFKLLLKSAPYTLLLIFTKCSPQRIA